MIQGGSIFDNSFLVPRSKLAFGFMDAIFDKADLVDLLKQSMQKAFIGAIESKNGAGLTDLLQLVKWMVLYSHLTALAS